MKDSSPLGLRSPTDGQVPALCQPLPGAGRRDQKDPGPALTDSQCFERNNAKIYSKVTPGNITRLLEKMLSLHQRKQQVAVAAPDSSTHLLTSAAPLPPRSQTESPRQQDDGQRNVIGAVLTGPLTQCIHPGNSC